MSWQKPLSFLLSVLLAVHCFAQGDRGKAELKAGPGIITIDYGQPMSHGKDRVGEQEVGQIWRMGKDAATILMTPVDLDFGSVKVPKGKYSLFLNRAATDKYELILNSQTGQWGTQHDSSKDFAKIPVKRESLPNLVEAFTIELQPAASGGVFEMRWGTTKLSAPFQFK
jgi:hypothetical protein